ncbi:MAG: PAS domain S-box protein [Thermoanaerobaculia bacterium]
MTPELFERQTLHAIAAASPFAAIVHDKEGRIVASNAEWVRLSGFSSDRTPTIADWCSLVKISRLGPRGRAHTGEAETLLDGYNVIRTAAGEPRICEVFTRQLAIDSGSLFVRTIVDVTHRVNADIERTRLASLLEHSTDMIALADFEGRLTYMNSGGRQMLGMPLDGSLEGMRLTDYVPPEWLSRFQSEILATIREKGHWDGEMQLQHVVSGERIDVARSAYLVRDSAGQPVGYGTVARNITARKQTEEALRRNAELITTLTENSTLGLAMMDERGYCTYANPALLAMTGLTSEEIGSATLHSLVHHHYADGRPYPIDECPIDRALPENFDVRAHEDVFFRKDGTMFPVQVAASPIFKDGRPVSTVIEIRDMTAPKAAEAALRESEERFRALADNISQLAWMADASGWIFWYNQRWFDFTGTTLKEMEGWGWRKVHHPDHVASVVQAVERGWAEGRGWEATFPLRRHDGVYRWFLTRATPQLDASGRVVRWLGTNTDITDLRDTQETLRHTAEALRDADRLKDEFLATLSHELRTPLTAILGWTQMLKLGLVTPAESQIALDTINRSAKAQADLIEDVLDISRITTGKMRLERRLQDPASVTEAALATIAPAAEAKGIAIHATLDHEIGPIFVDPNRLQQILWNLLSNAIKFSPRGATVELTLRRASENAEFEVRDEGPGISAEFLPHIFERFRQADSSTRRTYSGLGLGLALVKELANLHGGSVSVRSTLGKGSTFTLSLPMGHAPLSSNTSHNVAAVAGSAPLEGIHVLVVDDNPDSRLLISTMIRKLGAIATEAGSVEHALSLMERARPHVVLTDIAMPERDGFDLLKEVRARSTYTRIPVLAVTAQLDREGEASALAAGFSGYLRKPIDPQDLAERISALIGAR